MKKALDRAIKIAGGVTALAKKLKVDQSTVSQWRRRKSLPPEMVIPIELATDSQVTRHELRPDLYPRDAPA